MGETSGGNEGRSSPELPASPQGDAVVPVTVGTIAWAVAFLVLLGFHKQLTAHHATWWLWVSVTGFVLGVLGCWWVRRRRRRLEASSS